MNTLMWILAVILYLTINYLFALLNLWAWKNSVQVWTVEEKGEYGQSLTAYRASFDGIAKLLWPSASSNKNPVDTLAFGHRNNLREYLAIMTLIGSSTKLLTLPIEWVVSIIVDTLQDLLIGIVAIVGHMWIALSTAIAKLPGARKVL